RWRPASWTRCAGSSRTAWTRPTSCPCRSRSASAWAAPGARPRTEAGCRGPPECDHRGDQDGSHTRGPRRRAAHPRARTPGLLGFRRSVRELSHRRDPTPWWNGHGLALPGGSARPSILLISCPDGVLTYMTDTTTPQIAINDIGGADDLMAAIDATIKYFNDGDIVEGTVVKVDHDEVLLDIGYKTEGVIPSRELSIKQIGRAH